MASFELNLAIDCLEPRDSGTYSGQALEFVSLTRESLCSMRASNCEFRAFAVPGYRLRNSCFGVRINIMFANVSDPLFDVSVPAGI